MGDWPHQHDISDLGLAEVEAAIAPTADVDVPVCVDVHVGRTRQLHERLLLGGEARTGLRQRMPVDDAAAPIASVERLTKSFGQSRLVDEE